MLAHSPTLPAPLNRDGAASASGLGATARQQQAPWTAGLPQGACAPIGRRSPRPCMHAECEGPRGGHASARGGPAADDAHSIACCAQLPPQQSMPRATQASRAFPSRSAQSVLACAARCQQVLSGLCTLAAASLCEPTPRGERRPDSVGAIPRVWRGAREGREQRTWGTGASGTTPRWAKLAGERCGRRHPPKRGPEHGVGPTLAGPQGRGGPRLAVGRLRPWSQPGAACKASPAPAATLPPPSVLLGMQAAHAARRPGVYIARPSYDCSLATRWGSPHAAAAAPPPLHPLPPLQERARPPAPAPPCCTRCCLSRSARRHCPT